MMIPKKITIILVMAVSVGIGFAVFFKDAQVPLSKSEALDLASVALAGHPNHSQRSNAHLRLNEGVYTVKFPVSATDGLPKGSYFYKVRVDARTKEVLSIEFNREE